MLGAIIGDICGSRFERHNIKQKQFEFFEHRCRPTDDSIMTMAVARALLITTDPERLSAEVVSSMQELGRLYPYAGYGGRFAAWLQSDAPRPYHSWGNGAGMRVSPCAWAAESLDEVLKLSDTVTAVTHDHPEGMKGARAISAAVFLARKGKSRKEIRRHIEEDYYSLNFTLDQIRPSYKFDVSCQGSVPQAIEAFLEGTSFEDTVRGAVSIGGDSDTIACMAGSIAEAYWGIPERISGSGFHFLDEMQTGIVMAFLEKYVVPGLAKKENDSPDAREKIHDSD